MTRIVILFCCLFFSVKEVNQQINSNPITKKRMNKVEATATDTLSDDPIYNAKVLEVFFKKLEKNEKKDNQKINIVHIGDSHIQSDLMTNEVRKNLQQVFGNGGRGLIFPYQLAKTNGSYNERFSSNRAWNSYRNIHAVNDSPVGLSGIGLWRSNGEFVIELNVKDTAYKFNSIRIITPKNQNMFDLATSSKVNVTQSTERKVIKHKIKKGEAISIIADKYHVSIAEIRRENHLKSNTIRAGRTLRILTNETVPKTISRSEFIPLEMESDAFSHYYTSEKALSKIFLIPNKEASKYELNGIILEKNTSGLIYNSIGVNGAKFSDFNKYPLFFEQLKALHPDLLVFALGTNESFDHLETEVYLDHLKEFIKNIKAQNGDIPILIMTPPPSLFRGRKPNPFIVEYTKQLLEMAKSEGFAVWNLFQELGGSDGIQSLKTQGLIGPDWVHYTKKGYEKQGDLFSEAVLKAFDNYKLRK